MDTVKRFDYEQNLTNLRPMFSDSETVEAFAKVSYVTQINSFNLMKTNKDGVFMKLSVNDGIQSPMLYINPVVAQNLISQLSRVFPNEGFEADFTPLTEEQKHTIH